MKARSYTTYRIEASYESVSAHLAHCTDLHLGSAYDVGCGSGFDTFALASRFAHVTAIDVSRHAIHEARRIAHRAGIRNVDLRIADAETANPGSSVDLVWCNIMSHNVRSRSRLTSRLAECLHPGGWLMYAEECEGYVLREISGAIQAQHARSLIARIRQLIDGIMGAPTFRFFVGGTMRAELDAVGLEVKRDHMEAWNGVSAVHRLFAQSMLDSLDRSMPTEGEDRDYRVLPAELRWARSHLSYLLASRSRDGFAPRQREELATLARTPDQPLAPLLLVALMADMCMRPSMRASLQDRLRAKLPDRLLRRTVDWSGLSDLNRELMSVLRATSDRTCDRSVDVSE